MQTPNELAHAIDAASDAADEPLLRQLSDDCEQRLITAKDEERVLLRYYQSNAYAAIISSKHPDVDYTWSWEQPDGIQNILLLRQAMNEPSFQTLNPISTCQIRTNLANRLNSLGRPVAANEQWIKALEVFPGFAKALANRAKGLAFFANTFYDNGHAAVLAAAARAFYDEALASDAFWESGDRDLIIPDLVREREQIASFLTQIKYDHNFDLDQWSLGSTDRERSYRRWCLEERLFLNPLNEACTDTVAATDVLHLPNHIYALEEVPRFPAYYNLMKQEYVSARYRLYSAIHEDDPDFLMRDVLMLDSGEGQCLGHYTENLRSAFRSAYSIFDKVGLFLNDYFDVGLNVRDVTFRRIWCKASNNAAHNVRPMFEGRRNWPLRGLYFLSKDLFDLNFKEFSEPDADDLARLRNQLEHRFLSLQNMGTDDSTETHRFVSVKEFECKALRLLKMAREALIYLSLAMHREEYLRDETSQDKHKISVQLNPSQVYTFR